MSFGDVVAAGGITSRTWDDMDRQKAEEAYNAQVRKLNIESGRMNNAMLPARNAAMGARYALEKAQGEADVGLVGRKAANQGQALDIGGRALAEEAATFDTRAATNRNSLAAEAKQAELNLQKAGYELDTFPEKVLATMPEREQAGLATLGGLGIAVRTGVPQRVVDYFNNALRAGFVKGMEKEQVTGFKRDIAEYDGKQIPVLVFSTASGKTLPVSVDRIEENYKLLQKRDLKEVGGGLYSIRGEDVKTVVPPAQKWKAEPAAGIKIEEGSGTTAPLPGGSHEKTKEMDARVNMADKFVRQYLGASEFSGLDPASQSIYKEASLNIAGDLIRSGIDPEKAAYRAIEIVKKQAAVETTRGETKKGTTQQDRLDQLGKKHGF